MLYSEFKKKYVYTLKHYPDTSALFEKSDKITVETTTENKHGTKWVASEAPTIENVDYIYYFNTIDAIPFFKNLGGYERVSNAYTKHGYIPVKLVSISPDRNTRVTRIFKFK